WNNGQPRLTFQGAAHGDSADGPIAGATAQSDPIERVIPCITVRIDAGPRNLTGGDTLDVNMSAQNYSGFYPGTQFHTTGFQYTNVFPPPLRVILEGNANVTLEQLVGPTQPITSGPLTLGPDQPINFFWRYRVSGDGCFTLRGQLGARRLGGGPFYANLMDSDRICVQTPRGVLGQ